MWIICNRWMQAQVHFILSGPVCLQEHSGGLLYCGSFVRRGIRESRSSTAQEAWKEDEAAQEAVRASIRAVLVELFDKHNEIPFIATYRKAVR